MSNFSVIETDTKMLIDDTTDNFTIAQEIADEWSSATGATCHIEFDGKIVEAY